MTEEREEKHEAPGFDRWSAIPIGWILADTVGLLVMRHSWGVNAKETEESVESNIVQDNRRMDMSAMTKPALADSLQKLMLTKPLDKITVSDITEDCGVNRMILLLSF